MRENKTTNDESSTYIASNIRRYTVKLMTPRRPNHKEKNHVAFNGLNDRGCRRDLEADGVED